MNSSQRLHFKLCPLIPALNLDNSLHSTFSQVNTIFDNFVDCNYLLVRTGLARDHILKLQVWFSIILFFLSFFFLVSINLSIGTSSSSHKLAKKVEYFLWEYKTDWPLLF